MGPTVNPEALNQSREALQAFAADQASGNLRGRLILTGKGSDQKIVYQIGTSFVQAIKAKLLGTGSRSLAKVVDYCQKQEISCPELAKAADNYNTSRIFFKRITEANLDKLDKIQVERNKQIKAVIDTKNPSLDDLEKLKPSYTELNLAGFSNLDEKVKLSLLKAACEKRNNHLVSSIVINLAYNQKYFSEVRPELKPARYDTAFDMLIRNGMLDAVKFILSDLSANQVDALITRKNSRSSSPLQEAGIQIGELLRQKQDALIKEQLQKYESDTGVKTKTWAFSSSVVDKDKQFAMLKWAITFNKHCLALKLIPLMKHRLDHEDIQSLLRKRPDPTILACMKDHELTG